MKAEMEDMRNKGGRELEEKEEKRKKEKKDLAAIARNNKSASFVA